MSSQRIQFPLLPIVLALLLFAILIAVHPRQWLIMLICFFAGFIAALGITIRRN